MSKEFWDQTWSNFTPFLVDSEKIRKSANASDKAFLAIVGDVSGKSVLDMGCGNGELSVYLAKQGAMVTAVDSSGSAVENTRALANFNDISEKLDVHQLDLMHIESLRKTYDVVVGRFVLHHIEPFEGFCEVLYRVLVRTGRAIFLENSNRNKLLMFFRKFFTGRFGIPKHSDPDEYPFTEQEIKILRNRFSEVKVHYPEFMFFHLLGAYAPRKNVLFGVFCNKLDLLIYKYLPMLRKYSYRQIIEIRA